MLKNPHYILVALNMFIVVLLYGDLITNSFSIPEEFDQFYESREKYGRTSSGKSRYELHNYLKCKSGNIYEIGIIPDLEIQSGKEIEISQTKFLDKVKSFQFNENGIIKKVNLSVLMDPYILVFLNLMLLITVIYIAKKHALIEYGLFVFSGVTYSLAFVYLYYL